MASVKTALHVNDDDVEGYSHEQLVASWTDEVDQLIKLAGRNSAGSSNKQLRERLVLVAFSLETLLKFMTMEEAVP